MTWPSATWMAMATGTRLSSKTDPTKSGSTSHRPTMATHPMQRIPRLAANSGASHNIVPGYYLGSGVDADADGQPHPFALGDDLTRTDDENGVVFADTLFVGVANSVNVTASAAGLLDGWIDFNNDGDWNDAGEKIFVSVPLVAGVNALNFVVPSTATATFATFARFRFSSTGGRRHRPCGQWRGRGLLRADSRIGHGRRGGERRFRTLAGR